MIKLIADKRGYQIAVLNGDTHLSKWVEECGELCHDGAVALTILPLINPGDIVVDAGAAIGDHTIAYSKKVGPEGRVYAFEPMPLTFACLAVNMRDTSNVSIHNFGLSDSGSFVRMIPKPNAGASFIDWGSEYNTEPFVVTTVKTLDGLNIGRVDFIKVDVEGHELHLLKGARETISRYKPLVVCELNKPLLSRAGTSTEEVIGFMKSLGYRLESLERGRSVDGDHIDVLFRPL